MTKLIVAFVLIFLMLGLTIQGMSFIVPLSREKLAQDLRKVLNEQGLNLAPETDQPGKILDQIISTTLPGCVSAPTYFLPHSVGISANSLLPRVINLANGAEYRVQAYYINGTKALNSTLLQRLRLQVLGIKGLLTLQKPRHFRTTILAFLPEGCPSDLVPNLSAFWQSEDPIPAPFTLP